MAYKRLFEAVKNLKDLDKKLYNQILEYDDKHGYRTIQKIEILDNYISFMVLAGSPITRYIKDLCKRFKLDKIFNLNLSKSINLDKQGTYHYYEVFRK